MTQSYVSSAFATRSTSGRGKPSAIADLAHGRPRAVRDEVADHPRVLGAVALVDVLDDLLAPLRGEVDVDVRVGRPALVDEPLEQEVVADRVDPA